VTLVQLDGAVVRSAGSSRLSMVAGPRQRIETKSSITDRVAQSHSEVSKAAGRDTPVMVPRNTVGGGCGSISTSTCARGWYDTSQAGSPALAKPGG
jgi:hypothetical protein